MTARLPLALTVLGLCLATASPAAWAAESGAPMSKMSDGMHQGAMKKHVKHKGSMMKGDAMTNDEMKKDGTAPAQ